LDNGQPVVPGDELPHPGGQAGVEVVPDEYGRPAEPGAGVARQVAVVGPGEALTAVAASLRGWAVDQPGSFAWFIAGQRSDR
jgi:hypothetical protein